MRLKILVFSDRYRMVYLHFARLHINGNRLKNESWQSEMRKGRTTVDFIAAYNIGINLDIGCKSMSTVKSLLQKKSLLLHQ